MCRLPCCGRRWVRSSKARDKGVRPVWVGDEDDFGMKEGSGYAGGDPASAHYEIVGTGNTGHAESVKIVYDPSQITYGQILMIFFSVAHNPTELNKQGPDWGTQYRSSIFYSGDQQKKIAEAYIAQLDQQKVFKKPIVTLVSPLDKFYRGEDYHQDYALKNPASSYIQICDLPKIRALKQQFPELFVDYKGK